jgi:hypothetical protein
MNVDVHRMRVTEFGTRQKSRRRQHMANLGMSNAHVNQLNGSVTDKRFHAVRNASTRHKIQTAFYVTLFSAAFIFVAAIVCGVVV